MKFTFLTVEICKREQRGMLAYLIMFRLISMNHLMKIGPIDISFLKSLHIPPNIEVKLCLSIQGWKNLKMLQNIIELQISGLLIGKLDLLKAILNYRTILK